MPKFSQRHYEAIASAMAQTQPDMKTNPNGHAQWQIDCLALATLLKADNAKFKPSRFEEALGKMTDKGR